MIVAGAATSASAQEGFEAGAWRIAPNTSRNIIDVQTANLGGAMEWSANVFVVHAHAPLVLENFDGANPPYTPTSKTVLASQTSMRLLASFSPAEWVDTGLDLPLILTQEGDRLSGTTDPNGIGGSAGIGDVRLTTRLRFVDVSPSTTVGRFRIGGSLDIGLPTGDRDLLQGGGPHLTTLALADWQTPWGIGLTVNLGYSWRAETDYLGVPIRSSFAWGIGLEVPFLEHFRALATARGDQSTETTLAVSGTLHHFELLVGAGLPLVGDPAAPDWRLFAGIGYGRPSNAELDGDGDGVADEHDQCPLESEDVDGFQDDDGCPDADNDADGVDDVDDGCPTIAEDRDAFEDEDGCPDTDNDGDGIADEFDRCPLVVEDRDGFEDGDGCPEEDNDGDGIADAADRCPLDAEDIDGEDDEDGCPDRTDAMTISQVVYFEVGSADIPVTEHYALSRLAHTLVALPRGMHVWVEGYADDSGTDISNDQLSEQRANAVIAYLVERGVSRERMTPHAYGERIPAYANASDADRAINRRVEFRVAPRTLEDEPGSRAMQETREESE